MTKRRDSEKNLQSAIHERSKAERCCQVITCFASVSVLVRVGLNVFTILGGKLYDTDVDKKQCCFELIIIIFSLMSKPCAFLRMHLFFIRLSETYYATQCNGQILVTFLFK